jgi:hypothetical protein
MTTSHECNWKLTKSVAKLKIKHGSNLYLSYPIEELICTAFVIAECIIALLPRPPQVDRMIINGQNPDAPETFVFCTMS